jgi:cytochrome P450
MTELVHDPELDDEDDDLDLEDEDDEDELSRDEAEERFLAILNSATEITAAAVSNAGAEALKNPDAVAALFSKVFDTIVAL